MMSNKEIKKLALSKLGNSPFADRFIYFSFLCTIILFISYLLSFVSAKLLSKIVKFNPVPPILPIIIFLIVFICIFVSIAMYLGYNKALIDNSHSSLRFNIKELFYYLISLEDTMPFIAILFLCNLYICLWQMLAGIASVGFCFIFTLIFPLQLARILAPVIAIILFLGVAIYKTASYSMAIYIKIENKNISAIDCINNSKEIMNGNISKLIFLELSFLPWIFLIIISLGMIYPFVGTYVSAAHIEFYNFIKSNGTAEDANGNDFEVKKLKNKTLYLILTIALSFLLFVGVRFNSYKSFYQKHFKGNIHSTYSK